MQTADGESVRFGCLANFFAARRRHVGDASGQREGCQFDPVVADFFHEAALTFPVPTFEEFLADGEFHARSPSACGPAAVRERLHDIVRRRGMRADSELNRTRCSAYLSSGNGPPNG